MTYESYLLYLEQKIQERMSQEEEVKSVRVLKNNSVELDGFSYYVEGHRERPTVYVNDYYREDLTKEELEVIADRVLKTLRECQMFKSQSLEQILDFGKLKQRIFCRLISRERNEELLKEVPWIPWMDLAAVFYFRIPEEMMKHATALIRRGHMEYWKVTLEELCKAAAGNMAEEPVFFESIEEFMECAGFEPVSRGMYILSNLRKEYGAAVFMDPGVQRMCWETFGEDFYVIPSSIHELLLLPKSLSFGRADLDQLIQEVNATCVSPEEYLSSHAYLYSGETGVLT
ncbi:MAG: hypothetical protein K2P27_01125 [Lachnospiraceae bacterium]|nr:hypothetical protein [Lachnospiraceae bacterium]